MWRKTLLSLLACTVIAACGGSGQSDGGNSGSGNGGTGTTGDSQTPGVTSKAITVSVVYARSGPYGQLADSFFKAGFQTWVDDVNAHGGINGRQVVAKRVDDAGTADGGVAACKEVQGNGSYVAMPIEASVATQTFADCMNKANLVTFGAFTSLDPKWHTVFASQPLGTQFGRGLATYVHGPVGDASAKVGVIYLHEAYSESQRDGFLAEAKSIGLNVVKVESVEPNQSSYTSEVLSMRNAGVTHLVVLMAADVLGVVRDAKSINYSPHISGVLWPSFDLVSQGAKGLLNGAWGLRYVATLDSPAYATFEAQAKQYGNSMGPAVDGSAFLFYGDGLVMQKVLESAGQAPTTASLGTGIQSISAFDTAVLPPITWGPGVYEGSTAQFPAKCCNPDGTWKGLGPAKTAF
jgi:branched-chain amino acid transport system substrate-binding protein